MTKASKHHILIIVLILSALSAYIVTSKCWHIVENITEYRAPLLWENIHFLVLGVFFLPAISCITFRWSCWHANRVLSQTPSQISPDATLTPKKTPIFWFVVSILGMGLSLLLYTAWLKGDECFYCNLQYHFPFVRRVVFAIGHWLGRISRINDSMLIVTSMSPNRWQSFLITALFGTATPFAIWRLWGNRMNSIETAKGTLFFCFCFFLCLVSVKVNGYWRNFWDYAAAVNYLYPSVITIFFLSFYHPANWREATNDAQHGRFSLFLLFIMGVYCGWSAECITIILLPSLFLFMLYRVLKRLPIDNKCWYGFLGTIWGSILLFLTPALKLRSLSFCKSLADKWPSPEEKLQFLHNLSWESIECFNGGHRFILPLGTFEPFERLYFLPFLLETFWECCKYPVIVSLVLFACLMLSKSVTHKKAIITVTSICVLLAFGCACSYIAGCIPTEMSFLPASYIVAALACYLFLQLPWQSARCAVSIPVSVFALSIFIPAGIEAWQHKKYEGMMYSEIIRQKEEGIKDVVIVSPIPDKVENPIKLMPTVDVGSGLSLLVEKLELNSITIKWTHNSSEEEIEYHECPPPNF